MDTRDIDILDLLPQRQPMIMVDTLVHYDPVVTRTEMDVQPGNLFFEAGKLAEAGVIENIAQTCAARMGYMNRVSGQAVKIGFIGAIKGLTIHRLPSAGERIETTVTVLGEVGNMTLVHAESHTDSGSVAECEMKIAIIDEQ